MSAMDFNLGRIRRLAIDVIAREGQAADEAFELAQRTQALDTLMQVGTKPPADWATKQQVDGDALGEAARIALHDPVDPDVLRRRPRRSALPTSLPADPKDD